MKKRKWKKIVLTSAAVLFGLTLILALHIYWVMRPRIDDRTRIMARIDLNQPVSQADADRISAWLYQQKGVEHVLVNPASRIAVFTYAPVKADADRIVGEMRAGTPYGKAVRHQPPAADAVSGCPVAATSFTYKLYAFMKHVL